MREWFLLSRMGRRLADSDAGQALLRRQQGKHARVWRDSSGPPPHPVKQELLRELARRHGARVFVESGTYLGDMIFALRHDFDELHSIELSERFHRAACWRFRRFSNIFLHCGDSGATLESVLKPIQRRALLWLDGHYSGGTTARAAADGSQDCPVWRELAAIVAANGPRHVIAVDDLHLFNGSNGYPTLSSLRAFVERDLQGYALRTDRNAAILEPA